MERHFDDELKELKKNILNMASLVDGAVDNAMKALVNRDSALAEKVIDDDETIDMLEIAIDRQCLELLAKRQPIAIDLRMITSLMKINSDLERIADLAINIAYSAVSINKQPALKPLIDIPKMAEITRIMLKDSMLSFVEQDSGRAREICTRDMEVDRIYVQLFREIITYMMEDTKAIKRGIQLIFVAKHIERMADHVTNIAEDVVYMVEGKTIKHSFEEREKQSRTEHD